MGGNYHAGSKGRVQSKQADGRSRDKLKGDKEVELDCGDVKGVMRREVALMDLNGWTALRN